MCIRDSSETPQPATLSLHEVDNNWMPPSDWPIIYFEVDDVPEFLQQKNIIPTSDAEMKPYLWVEADIIDPSGNRIRIYQASENRRFPPWRVKDT